jgi:long-chain acyl-CoA synthetase
MTNYPYPLTDRERNNLTKTISYTHINSIGEIWEIVAQKHGNIVALCAPHLKPEVKITYRELADRMKCFASGLQSLGIQPKQPIALFADNSPRWAIADGGIMMTGSFDAVRSSQADPQELAAILANSEAKTIVLEDLKTLDRIAQLLPELSVKIVILLSDETVTENPNFKLLNFSDLMAIGQTNSFTPVRIDRTDIATLIYTSGTSGNPKGVVLTHANLLHQVNTCGTVLQPNPGAKILSILPIWHSFERACEYYLLSQACTQYYTNIRYLKQDMKDYQPEYLVAVPRLWESIYEGIQKQFREQPANKQKLIDTCFSISQKYITARRTVAGLDIDNLRPSAAQVAAARLQMVTLAPLHAIADRLVYKQVRAATGGKIKYVINGGGALPKYLDLFFEIVGIELLVGYGLTETSPVTNVRRPWRNLRPTSGQPLPATEIKIVDLETFKPLPVGQTGLVLIRGPQIMREYYRNPVDTAKAIDPDGWFNSGDLGFVTADGDLTITGRAKDTIVLSNGENIEPLAIENACLRSKYIDQIILVGQDAKYLGALIVPNTEALANWGQTEGKSIADLQAAHIKELFRAELTREVQNRPGYRADDRIITFRLLDEPFSIDNGLLTQTLKIRRPIVMERYHVTIDEMYQTK